MQRRTGTVNSTDYEIDELAAVGMYLREMPTWTAPERREPPHDPVDERTALEDRLDYHRTTLLMKCGGLTPHQLVQQSVPPSNLSLLGLVRHLSGVEAWFHGYDGRPTGTLTRWSPASTRRCGGSTST